MNNEIKHFEEISKEIERIRNCSDFHNRETLRGCCFLSCAYLKQFSWSNKEEYFLAKKEFDKEVSNIFQKSLENCKKYFVEVQYKKLKHSFTTMERNEEEAYERIKYKKIAKFKDMVSFNIEELKNN